MTGLIFFKLDITTDTTAPKALLILSGKTQKAITLQDAIAPSTLPPPHQTSQSSLHQATIAAKPANAPPHHTASEIDPQPPAADSATSAQLPTD
jgi:hypothetical protein